jgi:hypothetical protein
MTKRLADRLTAFKTENKFQERGKLAVGLVVTRKAKEQGLPIDPVSLLTENQGQVSGLSGTVVHRILKEYGELRHPGTEVGRTSRGTPMAATIYAEFLNQLHKDKLADLPAIEQWWAERFSDYFNNQPFKLNYDASRTMQAMFQDLLDQALKRQRESTGTSYQGAVLQHLVGAKLTLALPKVNVVHHGFSVADSVSARSGDFVIDDTALHCTTAPGELLLKKCSKNLRSGVRPIILTTGKGVSAAEVLAESEGILGRVEIMDAVQFLATNLYELSLFKTSERDVTIEKLIAEYNKIIDEHEPDKSLKIVME